MQIYYLVKKKEAEINAKREKNDNSSNKGKAT